MYINRNTGIKTMSLKRKNSSLSVCFFRSYEDVKKYMQSYHNGSYVNKNGNSIPVWKLGDWTLVRGFILTKFNKKSEQVQDTSTGKNISKMTVLRKPYWMVKTVDVNVMNVKSFVQNDRNFEMVVSV